MNNIAGGYLRTGCWRRYLYGCKTVIIRPKYSTLNCCRGLCMGRQENPLTDSPARLTVSAVPEYPMISYNVEHTCSGPVRLKMKSETGALVCIRASFTVGTPSVTAPARNSGYPLPFRLFPNSRIFETPWLHIPEDGAIRTYRYENRQSNLSYVLSETSLRLRHDLSSQPYGTEFSCVQQDLP